MTGFNEPLYLDAMAIFCALMAIMNLGRARTRGLSAYFLASAFLVLGCTLLLYSAKGQSLWTWIGGIAVGVLLVADIVYRTMRGHGNGKGSGS
jgi:hypothetical protein